MTSTIGHITFDVRDPAAIAPFWAAALGFVENPEDPNDPDDDEHELIDPRGLHPALLFIRVPDGKVVKNRVHLDLRPAGPDGRREPEVERLTALGATVVDDRREPDGSGWVVLADPEGNELCIVRSAAERGTPPPADTGERRFPGVRTAGEREALEGMLDWYREGVIAKATGVSQLHAAARPLRTGTTIAGLVKHLASVEDGWFSNLAGTPEPEPWASAPWEDDVDWEFTSAREEPLEDSIALYRAAIERSRTIAAGLQLDDVSVRCSERGPFTLRFVLVHLLEETARHLGHLDVLRELLDGTTGD